MDKLFIGFQYLVPQHLLSRLVGYLAETKISWLKNLLIKSFIKQYDVDMSLALNSDYKSYENFNAFFTRPLKPDARPITSEPKALACPADGAISQLGDIVHGRIFQAKGQSFSAYEILGGDQATADLFQDGKFATIYLSPKDYHRLHMPLAGKLISMTYIPGDLFSVNNTTADNVPSLFARNERAVCLFETEAGPMAMILVGAMIVAAIETVWAGQIAPANKAIKTVDYRNPAPVELDKGEEMGRFKLGSTVVLLFGKDQVEWAEELVHGSPTKMGENMGIVT